MNALLTWLTDGQKKLKEKLSRLTKDSKSSAKTHYKPRGTKQAKRTEQHHAKQAKDAYKKARADGFGDLQMMFMQKSGPPNINELVKDGIWEIEKPKSCEEVEDRDSEEVEVEDDTEIS